MKVKLRLPAALVFMMFTSGCGTWEVMSRFPVGQTPYPVEAEEWAGDWGSGCADEGFFRIEVVDKDNGIIRVSEVKAGSESGPENPEKSAAPYEKPFECHLRKTDGDLIFANAALEGETEYYPTLVKMVKMEKVGGCQLIVWFPDYRKFRTLVEKKILPGELRERSENICLGLLQPEHLKIILSEDEVLFRCYDPIILIRHGKAPAPPSKEIPH